MTTSNRNRASSFTASLLWLGGGIVVGVLAGLAFIFFGADRVFPQARSDDPVADCRQHLADLANDIWVGYNKGQRADSLDDLRSSRGTDAKTFRCPAAAGEPGAASDGGLATDYIYAPGMGEGDAILPPLLFELPANHGQTLCHVMPRNPDQPTELHDVSHIHGHVQHLNDYLTQLRAQGAQERTSKTPGTEESK